MKTHLPYPVLISGFIGSGKSTLAQHLAKTYKGKYISGSQIHKQLAEEHLKLQQTKSIAHGFWETSDGKKGTELRAKNLEIDREADRRLLAFLTKHPHTVTDARLMPWLYPKKAVRIWLGASEDERVKRVAQRDSLIHSDVRTKIRSRFATDKKIWQTLYQIDFGIDMQPFNLVIQNDQLTPNQTYTIVKTYLDACFTHEAKKK